MELHIRNFRSIVNADYEFNAGTNWLVGETGTGKTTILKAIEWCLYKTIKKIINIDAPDKPVAVSIVINGLIRVYRQHTKTTKDVNVYDLRNGSVKKMDELFIEEVFGDKSNIRLWFNNQYELSRLLVGTQTERAEILNEICLFDKEYLPIVDQIDKDVKCLNDEIKKLEWEANSYGDPIDISTSDTVESLESILSATTKKITRIEQQYRDTKRDYELYKRKLQEHEEKKRSIESDLKKIDVPSWVNIFSIEEGKKYVGYMTTNTSNSIVIDKLKAHVSNVAIDTIINNKELLSSLRSINTTSDMFVAQVKLSSLKKYNKYLSSGYGSVDTCSIELHLGDYLESTPRDAYSDLCAQELKANILTCPKCDTDLYIDRDGKLKENNQPLAKRRKIQNIYEQKNIASKILEFNLPIKLILSHSKYLSDNKDKMSRWYQYHDIMEQLGMKFLGDLFSVVSIIRDYKVPKESVPEKPFWYTPEINLEILDILLTKKSRLEKELKSIEWHIGTIDLASLHTAYSNAKSEYQEIDDMKSFASTCSNKIRSVKRRDIDVKLGERRRRKVCLSELKNIVIEVRNTRYDEFLMNINSTLESIVKDFFDQSFVANIESHTKLKSGAEQPKISLTISLNESDLGDYSELSGGEKFRLSLAIVLSLLPYIKSPIIIMDEPLIGMSVDKRTECLEVVKYYSQLHGKICLMTAHDYPNVSDDDKLVTIG